MAGSAPLSDDAVIAVGVGGAWRGEVFLPARLIPKLRRFLTWKRRHGESLESDAPLFVSAQGRRLSPRAAQWRFAWRPTEIQVSFHSGSFSIRR